MHASAYLRRLSRQFSISAPRMAVRTQLGWPWRVVIGTGFAAVVAGMWWWGFDFGQLFGGLARQEVEARVVTLAAELDTAKREASELRAQNIRLQSDLAMMQGLQATVQKQQAVLVQENANLKDELSFLQSFFAEAGRGAPIGIQRLAVDGRAGDIARYSVLMVRGAGAKGEFDGHLALQAEVVPTESAPPGSVPRSIALPEDRPDVAGTMKLRFKYYQRLEGTLRVPPGYALRAVTANAFESGVAGPRASRTLTLP